jgi:hypothetical protein
MGYKVAGINLICKPGKLGYARINFSFLKPSKQKPLLKGLFNSCEEKDRTSDLRVMSPTSYRCSTSHCKYSRTTAPGQKTLIQASK